MIYRRGGSIMTNNIQSGTEIENSIYHILIDEVSAYDYLNETIQNKQSAIVKNDLKQIEHLTGVEQVVVKRANDLTQERHSLMQQYFMSDQMVGEPLSLANLISTLKEAQRAPWKRMNHHLTQTVQSIQQKNAENLRLIDSSLTFVRGTVQLFVPREEFSSDLYSKNGPDAKNFKAKNLLDCNA